MARTSTAIIMCTLFTVSSCSLASDSKEQLTTTLYPVNRTFDLKQQESNNVYNNKHTSNTIGNNDRLKIKEHIKETKINNISNNILNSLNDDGTPKISDEDLKNKDREQKQNHKTDESEKIVVTDGQTKDYITDDQKPNGKSNAVANGVKDEVTTWSLETNYSQADENDCEKDFKEEPKKIIKEFRPSPHLGSFYGEDAFALTTEASVVPWNPFTKPSSFIRSPQDFYKLNYKKPINEPYKFETNYPAFPDPTYWKHHTGLESKPTDPVPIKTPAGGLYKSPGVFKDQPITSQEYGVSYKEEAKGNSNKKGISPWKSFLQLASALLPMGLIVSALTPGVIALQSTDNTPYYGNRITRRVEGSKHLPVISEACKRRLLCELHAGHHSEQIPSGHKHCYKLHCEDPAAMKTVLRFVLTHRPPGGPPAAGGSPPGAVVPLG